MYDCEWPLDEEEVHVSRFASSCQVPLEVTEGVTLQPKDRLFIKFEMRK